MLIEKIEEEKEDNPPFEVQHKWRQAMQIEDYPLLPEIIIEKSEEKQQTIEAEHAKLTERTTLSPTTSASS